MPRNQAATIHCGNLDDRVNERILYEVMVQAGPVVDIHIPRDRESQKHKGYGFAEYDTEDSAQYAVNLFSNLLNLFDRPVRISLSGADKVALQNLPNRILGQHGQLLPTMHQPSLLGALYPGYPGYGYGYGNLPSPHFNGLLGAPPQFSRLR